MSNIASTITCPARPEWMPPELYRKVAGQRVEVQLSRAERRVFRKKKLGWTSEWAEKNRVLTMSDLPGPWHNDVTPYLKGIMDASCFSCVRDISLCAAPQTGKTEAAHNIIGHRIDRAPGPVLYVYPDEITGRENSQDRITPMIRSSAALSKYLSSVKDDVSTLRINLQHMPIYIAWAHSASRLGNKPIRYVVMDEVDKYPDTAGRREASPIKLAQDRTRTYRWNCLLLQISTPTIETGNIWQALQSAAVVFDFHVVCPDCGNAHVMEFDNFKWPDDVRDPVIMREQDCAWYECPQCKSHWKDARRDAAVRWGSWRDRKNGEEMYACIEKRRPKSVGFHLPAWYSQFVGLSECASAFLKGLHDKNALKHFRNSYEAKPWKDYTAERSEDRIMALRDDRPAGVVPGGNRVCALTAGIDTQDDGFWYEIRAWGWPQISDEQVVHLESWGVRCGFLMHFSDLKKVLWRDAYRDADGNTYLVQLAVQDAMGHRTHEVYAFCRNHRGFILPAQGVDRMQSQFQFSTIEYWPGTKRPIPGGIKLLRTNVTYYKNKLAQVLEIAPGDPGAWHYHCEMPIEWARHMVAEHRNEKELWECPDGRPNHGWDCSVYNLAAADVLGIQYWAKEHHHTKTKTQTDEEQSAAFLAEKQGWLER